MAENGKWAENGREMAGKWPCTGPREAGVCMRALARRGWVEGGMGAHGPALDSDLGHFWPQCRKMGGNGRKMGGKWAEICREMAGKAGTARLMSMAGVDG